jgi:hypothetical protein
MQTSPTNANTPPPSAKSYTAFQGERHLMSGAIAKVGHAAKAAFDAVPELPLQIFDDSTGREIDLHLHGSATEVQRRLAMQFPLPEEESTEDEGETTPTSRSRGRPKLGVIAREVTLLPRHWDWLNAQPGSASVALRKLIDEARQKYAARDRRLQAQNAAYHFMSAIAGDKVNFEEASRALFAHDQTCFNALISAWPQDIAAHCAKLAAPIFESEPSKEST